MSKIKILLILLFLPVFNLFSLDESKGTDVDISFSALVSTAKDLFEISDIKKIRDFMDASDHLYDNVPIVEHALEKILTFLGYDDNYEIIINESMEAKVFFLKLCLEHMENKRYFLSQQVLFSEDGVFFGYDVSEVVLDGVNFKSVPDVELFVHYLLGYEYSKIVNMPMQNKVKNLRYFLEKVQSGAGTVFEVLASLEAQESGIKVARDRRVEEEGLAEDAVVKALAEKYKQNLTQAEYEKIFNTPEKGEANITAFYAELAAVGEEGFVAAAKRMGLWDAIKEEVYGDYDYYYSDDGYGSESDDEGEPESKREELAVDYKAKLEEYLDVIKEELGEGEYRKALADIDHSWPWNEKLRALLNKYKFLPSEIESYINNYICKYYSGEYTADCYGLESMAINAIVEGLKVSDILVQLKQEVESGGDYYRKISEGEISAAKKVIPEPITTYVDDLPKGKKELVMSRLVKHVVAAEGEFYPDIPAHALRIYGNEDKAKEYLRAVLDASVFAELEKNIDEYATWEDFARKSIDDLEMMYGPREYDSDLTGMGYGIGSAYSGKEKLTDEQRARYKAKFLSWGVSRRFEKALDKFLSQTDLVG